MTLILSAIVGSCAYQASDRQATQLDRVYDATWNKTVVLRTTDALVSFGFGMDAFVSRVPTDEWAVETMAATEMHGGMLGGRPESRAGLRTSVRRLVVGSRATPTLRLEAAAVGWRIRGGVLRPCFLTLSKARQAAMEVQEHAGPRMRRKGALVGACPDGWVSQGRLEQLAQALGTSGSHEAREDSLIELIREVATAGSHVGPHVMCVRIPGEEPRPVIRFAPATQHWLRIDAGDRATDVPAVHTPAIVSPVAVMLASVASGPPMANLGGFEIDWRLPTQPPRVPGGGLLWAMGSDSARRRRRQGRF